MEEKCAGYGVVKESQINLGCANLMDFVLFLISLEIDLPYGSFENTIDSIKAALWLSFLCAEKSLRDCENTVFPSWSREFH